jgi:hypothetical protein
MDLLVFLAQRAGRVVSRDEIIDAVWAGRFIADTTLNRSVADLRRALGDNQRTPEYIETIPKRGYRLVAAVSTAPVADDNRRGSGLVPGTRIADLLASERRRRFVGREREIDMFRSALQAEQPSFVALHVSGPGGVGKTTLLEEFARVAQAAGRAIIRIDGRNVEPSPLGFIVALSHALGAERSAASLGAALPRCDLAAVIERWPAGGVLLVDTYELLVPVDEWLRGTLLPQLPARSLVVIGGRNEAGAAWQTDVEWAGLTRIHSLGNLDAEESRTYLARCSVPAAYHDEALAFTRGHPLALSLTAAVLSRGERLAPRLETEPDVVRLLIEKFVQDVPSREHRVALHVCMSARATTEPLLAAVLDRTDVHELFEWLAQLSFVESGPYGLFPHDLARDVIYMDFRWRDPDAAYRVTERLITFLYDRFQRTPGMDRLHVWYDLIYLQRYNPHLRPYMEWPGFTTTYVEIARPQDHAAVVAMIEQHEGAASAAIAQYWLTRQPEAFLVARSVAGELVGLAVHLHFEAVTRADLDADPAVARAVAHAERYGPPRAGEHITYCRFFMQRERYQTYVLAPVSATASQNWIAPALAWCFIAVADPDRMAPMFNELHIWRVRDADFEVGGRRYGVFAHDWRVENAEAWLRLKAERAWRIENAFAPAQSVI